MTVLPLERSCRLLLRVLPVVLVACAGEAEPESGDDVLDLEGLLVVRVVDGEGDSPVEGASVEITRVGEATGPDPAKTNADGLMVVQPPDAERMIAVHANDHAPNRKRAPQSTGFVEVRTAPTETFSLAAEGAKQNRPFRPIETANGTRLDVSRAGRSELETPVMIVADPDLRDSRGLGNLPELETAATDTRPPGRIQPGHAVYVDIRDGRDLEQAATEEPITRRPSNVGDLEVAVTSPPRFERPLDPPDDPPAVFHYDEEHDRWVRTTVAAQESSGDAGNEVQYTVDAPGWWAVGWEIEQFTCVRSCVRDAAGEPVGGAQLTLLGSGANVDSVTAYTNSRGCFGADVKPGESYVVLASTAEGEQYARIDDTGPAGPRLSEGGSCVQLDDIQLEARDIQEALCATGAEQCGDECVDITRNQDHCGSCGSTCDDGTRCLAGECIELNQDTAMESCEPGRAGPLCEPCPAGNYCPGGDAAPMPCPAGRFDHDADPATPCRAHTTCEAGSFVSQNGSSTRDVECATCEPGSFSDAPDAQMCEPWSPCPAGDRMVSTGTATQDRLCGDCETGTYCEGGTAEPVPCATGSWDHDADPATECTPHTVCSPGQRVVSSGDATTNTTCTQCAAGTFSDVEDATSCESWTDCMPGEFVAQEGSTRADRVCAACPQGTNSLTANSPQCVLAGECQAGTVEVEPATTSSDAVCEDCSSGEFCPGGSQPAVPCGDGDWDHDLDPVTACQPWKACSPGEYLTEEGSATQDATCATCPSGTTSITENATRCGVYHFVDVDMARRQVCGIRADNGRVMCWGDNNYSYPWYPSDQAFVSIDMNIWYACGITAAGGRVCWGDVPNEAVLCSIDDETGYFDCVGDDPGSSGYTQRPTDVAVVDVDHAWDVDFGDYGCYVRASDQQVGCWGYAPEELEDPVAGTQFVDIGVGNNGGSEPWVACGIRESDRGLECWGPTSADARAFADSLAGVPIRDLEVNGNEVCLFRDDTDRFLCKERDVGGAADFPLQTAGLGLYGVGCGLANDGLVTCWGGQPQTWATLGQPSTTRYSEVFAGGDALGCARREAGNEIECWEPISDSYNEFGELGVPEVDFTTVATAGLTVCGIRSSDNLVQCWGEPIAGAPDFAVSTITAGSGHFCVLRESNGMPYCWGLDDNGQVSDAPDQALSGLDSGSIGNCALTSNDRAVCWGGTTNGDISDAPNSAFRQVATDGTRACGIRESDDTVECWGVTWGVEVPALVADSIELNGDTPTLCYFPKGSRVPECWTSIYTQTQWAVPTEALDAMQAVGSSMCGIRSSDKTLTCWGERVRFPKAVPTNPSL